MSFQNPYMLWGLFALLIPIIIHLFNFRRHKVILFSNIELLKNLQEETNKTNKLKHFIVLITRMLAILFLVLAFAQPYFPVNEALKVKQNQLVGVYIDNSISMQLRGREMTLLEEVKEQAVHMAGKFELGTRFQLITNDFQPRHSHTLSRMEFLNELSQVKHSPASVDFGDVVIRNKAMHAEDLSTDRFLFAYSDFQQKATDWDRLPSDSSLRLFMLPVSATEKNNVFIDSIWLDSPVLQEGMEAIMHLRITNEGADDIRGIPVRMELDGVQTAVTNLDIEAESVANTSMQFLSPGAGFHKGVLSIQDYPIVFDDEMFFSLIIQPEMQVLEIYENTPDQWISLLFEGNESVQLTAIQRLKLDFQSLSIYQLIFLNQLESIPTGLQQSLEQFVEAGGNLILLPATKGLVDYSTFSKMFGFGYLAQDTVQTRIFTIEEKHPLFKNVFVKIPENADLPKVYKRFPIKIEEKSTAFSLLNLLIGDPFLVVSGKSKGGKVYGFTTPFDVAYSSFSRNSLFAPIIYRILLMSSGTQPLYYVAGNELKIPLKSIPDSEDPVLRVRDDANELEVIPGIAIESGSSQIVINQLHKSSSHYNVYASDQLISVFSLNADRKESRLKYMSSDELKAVGASRFFKQYEVVTDTGGTTQSQINLLVSGNHWYKYLIIFVLLFLLIEGLILRFWK